MDFDPPALPSGWYRYEFNGSDSSAQFTVWLVFSGGGTLLAAPAVACRLGGARAAWVVVMVALLLVAGLRASIVATPAEVVITKRWFLVPYGRWRSRTIVDVWYGGDWGLEEGAMGVVVRLGSGSEVHIGSSRTMRGLHDALSSVMARRCGSAPRPC